MSTNPADQLPNHRAWQEALSDEIVLDDEPIHEILYSTTQTRPTAAGMFAQARECLGEILAADRRRDTEGVLSQTRQLVLAQPLPRQVFDSLSPVLHALPETCLVSGPTADNLVLLERLCELGRLHDQSLFASAGIVLASWLWQDGDMARAAKTWWELRESQRVATIDIENVVLRFADGASLDCCQRGSATITLALQAYSASLQDLILGITPTHAHEPATSVTDNRPLVQLLNALASRFQHLYAKLANVPSNAASLAFLRRLRTTALMALAAGDDHPFTLTCLNMLIRLLQDQLEHESAVALSRLAIQLREQQLGATHRLLSASLNNLGLSLVCLGQFEEAEYILKRAIAIQVANPYPWYWLAKLLGLRRDAPDTELRAWENYQQRAYADEEYLRTQVGRERLAEAKQRTDELIFSIAHFAPESDSTSRDKGGTS